MASGRIPYSRTTSLGQQIQTVMTLGTQFRSRTFELSLVVGRYNDDNAGLATDAGIDPALVQGFKDLLARTAAETTATNLVDVLAGQESMTRTLLDSMG